MDWQNERYVRVYVRDTDDWLALSYDARSLWVHLLRKVDRAGVLQTKRGTRGIAAQTGCPLEVVDRVLAELLADGCLEEHALGYVVPNFIEAQEAPQSDRLRASESRARRRDRVRADTPVALGLTVTKRDSSVTNRDGAVTERIASVTSSHTASRPVTSCHSDPSDPCLTDPEPEALAPRAPAIPALGSTHLVAQHARRTLVNALWEEHQTARRATAAELGVEDRPLGLHNAGWKLLSERVLELAAEGLEQAEERCRHVLAIAVRDCHRDSTMRYLDGQLWRKDRFEVADALPLSDKHVPRGGHNGHARAGPPRSAMQAVLDDIADQKRREAAARGGK